ncbi:MAG: type II toxin-antitoxin system RelE/ParE family toxin [Verrucomicrobiales bacterium]|nr:type II toxin-antitoxin system RelE/ParE family toxin [Verrucomicrobiales bacterium]
MRWDYKFHELALKELRRLDQPVQRQIFKYLDKHVCQSPNPLAYAKPLLGRYFGLVRFRVGAYRLICRPLERELLIMVTEVGNRRDIYEE